MEYARGWVNYHASGFNVTAITIDAIDSSDVLVQVYMTKTSRKILQVEVSPSSSSCYAMIEARLLTEHHATDG